jgi:hypothetical protein
MPRQVRPIRIEGNIAYVPLTKGYEAVIDAADVALVEAHNWCASVDANTVYAQRKDCSGPKKRTVWLHRAIMGEPSGLKVDHKDGNGLNNRRYNLREATHAENMRNRRTNENNTSGFKGVYLNKQSEKWCAQIKLNGKNRQLGRFDTPEEAHAAYATASAKLHGEFAKLTFTKDAADA